MRGIERHLSGRGSRSSLGLLALALFTTAVVLVAGNALVWGLYRSEYASLGQPSGEAAAVSGEPLHFGIARTPGGPKEWITFAKVLAQLQRDLGRPVITHYALSSEDQIRLFSRGELDVALMSTLAYLDVHAAGLVDIVGTAVVDGESLDAAVLVVPAASDAERIEDLRGRRFAVSPDLAGASFTYWLLTERGQDPLGFFSQTSPGVQDANLAKVASGEADVTGVRRSALAGWPDGVFRVIEHSRDLGMPPIVARKTLDQETADRVRQSLFSAAERGVMPDDSTISGFREASDADYEFARTLDAIDRSSEIAAFGSAHQ